MKIIVTLVREWMKSIRVQFLVWHAIHWKKYTWIVSGVKLGANNVRSDTGFIRLHNFRRAEVIAAVRDSYPGAVILHIDDRNKIVTYQI